MVLWDDNNNHYNSDLKKETHTHNLKTFLNVHFSFFCNIQPLQPATIVLLGDKVHSHYSLKYSYYHVVF